MVSLITAVLFLLTIPSLQYSCIMAQLLAPSETSHNKKFARDLLSLIAVNKSTQNIVYSPASIYTCLAFTYLGAEGLTAEEIRKVLRLDDHQEDKLEFALKYGDFLKSTFKKTKAKDNAPQLKMATRLYVNSKIKILQKFNEIAVENFDSQAENADFSQTLQVANKINEWVEQQTENKIKNIIRPDGINSDTSAILVNAIYFKAKWLRPFSLSFTIKKPFYLNSRQKIDVDTMQTDDRFHYGEFPDLEAKALEMPYENSDISMLIMLPNEIDGLEKLEQRLKGINLNDITSKMVQQSVDVVLPKFRIDFDIDLKEPLQKMGCSSMFGHNVNLSGIFESDIPQRISNIKHKAFFDCNEAGSEAAAATYLKIVPMSLNLDQKTFRADHPFLFVVRSKTTVFFAGHIANFS